MVKVKNANLTVKMLLLLLKGILIGSIVFIFLTQAVIAYFTMFKRFECDTGTKVGKSIVFSLISTPFYSILFGVAFAFFFPYSVGIPILMIIGLFIYCITSYR